MRGAVTKLCAEQQQTQLKECGYASLKANAAWLTSSSRPSGRSQGCLVMYGAASKGLHKMAGNKPEYGTAWTIVTLATADSKEQQPVGGGAAILRQKSSLNEIAWLLLPPDSPAMTPLF